MTENSVKFLKGADRVRLRPELIFGSKGIDGAFNTFKEVLCNALDEANKGRGDLVEITYHADNSISIRDYGQGISLSYIEQSNRYAWELIFTELPSFAKPTGMSALGYAFSLGFGLVSTQYSSEFLNVTSYQLDKVYKKSFAKGNPLDTGLLVEDNTTGKTGTLIHWKPDNEVFSETAFPFDMLKDYCEMQSYVRSVPITLLNEATGEFVLYPGTGVADYLLTKLPSLPLVLASKKVYSEGTYNNEKYGASCEVALAIPSQADDKYLYFHNATKVDSRTGVHDKAFDDAVTAFFQARSKSKSIKILPCNYADYINIVISTYANITHYTSSKKDGITCTFIYTLIYDTITAILNELLAQSNSELLAIIDLVLDDAMNCCNTY